MKRCLNDGHSFEGQSFSYPVDVDPATNKFTLAPVHFCSLSCAKFYIRRDINLNPHLLNWFDLYARTQFGVDHVDTAPDPRVLDCYATFDGISISEYRNQGKKEKHFFKEHGNMDPNVFQQNQQCNSNPVIKVSAPLLPQESGNFEVEQE